MTAFLVLGLVLCGFFLLILVAEIIGKVIGSIYDAVQERKFRKELAERDRQRVNP